LLLNRPEEIVRQKVIKRLIEECGFPASWIAVEKKVPPLSRRLDILCYINGMHPFLLIECKAEKIGEEAAKQAMGYNFYVKAPFVAVANGEEIRLVDESYQLGESLPTCAVLCHRLQSVTR